MAKKSLPVTSPAALPEGSALEAYDALTLKLSQVKGLTRLIRTSGLNSCLVSVATCAGLLEDIVDLADNDAAAVYLHAAAARDLLEKMHVVVDEGTP